MSIEQTISEMRTAIQPHYMCVRAEFNEDGTVKFGIALSLEKSDNMAHIHNFGGDLSVMINEAVRQCNFINYRIRPEWADDHILEDGTVT